jgi:hypothetical protein
MDFVDWCDAVLRKLLELSQSSPMAQSYGVGESTLIEALFSADNIAEHHYQSVFDAVRESRRNGLVSSPGDNTVWLVTEAGRQHANDRHQLWREVCRIEFAFPEESQVLELINMLSQHQDGELAWVEYVDQDTLLSQLPGVEMYQLRITAQRLVDLGLIDGEFASQAADFRATYRGLVWATRCVRSKVFVSYRRGPSEAYALLLAEKLARYGITVFVDTLTVEGAEPFPQRLLQGIQACDVFVCLLAPSTLESEWVQREIEHAQLLGKSMIPVFQPNYMPEDATHYPPYVTDLLECEGITMNSGYIAEGIEKLAEMIERTWYRQLGKPST